MYYHFPSFAVIGVKTQHIWQLESFSKDINFTPFSCGSFYFEAVSHWDRESSFLARLSTSRIILTIAAAWSLWLWLWSTLLLQLLYRFCSGKLKLVNTGESAQGCCYRLWLILQIERIYNIWRWLEKCEFITKPNILTPIFWSDLN